MDVVLLRIYDYSRYGKKRSKSVDDGRRDWRGDMNGRCDQLQVHGELRTEGQSDEGRGDRRYNFNA
jgi:hypothetical protein